MIRTSKFKFSFRGLHEYVQFILFFVLTLLPVYAFQKLVSFGSNMKEVDKENITLPDYLPEDVDSPKAHTKPLARNKDDTKKANGWLTSAASFITNSFYW